MFPFVCLFPLHYPFVLTHLYVDQPYLVKRGRAWRRSGVGECWRPALKTPGGITAMWWLPLSCSAMWWLPLSFFPLDKWRDVCGIQFVAYTRQYNAYQCLRQAVLAATVPNTDQMLWYTASSIHLSLGPLYVLSLIPFCPHQAFTRPRAGYFLVMSTRTKAGYKTISQRDDEWSADEADQRSRNMARAPAGLGKPDPWLISLRGTWRAHTLCPGIQAIYYTGRSVHRDPPF